MKNTHTYAVSAILLATLLSCGGGGSETAQTSPPAQPILPPKPAVPDQPVSPIQPVTPVPPVPQPQSLLLAPFLSGQYFCSEAVTNPLVLNEEDAALLCASNGTTGAARITTALDAIGPKISPSGKYQLGYTLTMPMFRYFKKVNDKWELDNETLKANLTTITEVDRPVVVYLSGNHFTDAGLVLSAELANDSRNLMWTRSGPLLPDDYFHNPVIAWTLTDQTAPVNVMRRQVVNAAVDAICSLPEASRNKIVAVSLLGEVHHLFPNITGGPSFSIPEYDATDYSPAATQGFRAWLKQKYVSIFMLNSDLAGQFTSFEQINPPSRDIHTEQLSTYFDHIDTYAAGAVPIYGWLNDTKGRDLKVTVFLDGKQVGTARTGLSRTDVTDALPTINDPNLGFRFNLDYRNIAYGIHTLEVLVSANGAAPLRLSKRNLVLVNRQQDPPLQIPYVDINVQGMNTDPSLSGNLDGPLDWASAFYNPMAQLWLEYRNQVVRNYIEQFAAIVAKSCIPEEKIFSYQITPLLVGSWNGDLLAADASKQLNALYNQGTTLYGGGAFGKAFLAMKNELGWGRYSVSEMHPVVKLDASQYLAMFDMHRMAGATFVAPYYMSIVPDRLPDGGGLDQFLIAPNNPLHGSDAYWQSIKDVMKQ